MFVRIAEELNGGVPQGDRWRRRLVTDMSLEIPGVRPAAIDAALADALGEFLRLRLDFRNAYGFVQEGKRMRPLEERLPVVLEMFRTRIRVFLTWLTDSPTDRQGSGAVERRGVLEGGWGPSGAEGDDWRGAARDVGMRAAAARSV